MRLAVAALLALCHIAAAGQSDRELCAAARDGDRAESQRLLDTGYADANTANTRRCACNTKQYSRSPVLSIAAQGGHTEVVALLIERGADVAATDRRGELVAGRRHVIISSSSSSEEVVGCVVVVVGGGVDRRVACSPFKMTNLHGASIGRKAVSQARLAWRAQWNSFFITGA